jgi:hypothetical protein
MKTDTRDVRSISYPPFRARKVFLYCPICKQESEKIENLNWKHTPNISQLSRGKSPFSMDVVAHVGKMKFLECERRDEIKEELMDQYGNYASTGSLTSMGKEFLVRVKCLHLLRFGRLVDDIETGGGYILGIDGTGDGGSDRIFLGMDLTRDWVLTSGRIPSESEEEMKPYIEFLKRKMAPPLANVCDMSTSMMNVLTNVMVGVPLRVCHYHFLDDVGGDIMKDDYALARQMLIDTKLRAYLNRVRKNMYPELEKDDIDISKIARELRIGLVPSGISIDVCTRVQVYDAISWMLRYHEDNHGLRFPFTLPYLNFYKRCLKGLGVVTAIRKVAANGGISPKYIRDLETKIRVQLNDQKEVPKALITATDNLEKSFKMFEELRETLHIPRDKGDIPRDQLIIKNNETISKMKNDLEAFRKRLREITSDGQHSMEKVVLQHLDKYWYNIILDNAVVEIDGKKELIEIPRTSSGYETRFGMMKSDLRKRLGKKDIGRELNMYGDYLCYVQNLKNESYVSLMYGSLDDIPKAFEIIPDDMVKKEMELLRKRMTGYDVTKSSRSEKMVKVDDIMKGVMAVEDRLETVLFEEYIRPPELYGRQSNGFLTL